MIAMRFEYGNTLNEIAKSIEVSSTRVMQIIAKALRKLRRESSVNSPQWAELELNNLESKQ